MYYYSKSVLLLLCCTLATPLYTSRWQHAYKCELNSMLPRCCVSTWKIIPWMENKVCLVEEQPQRFSILIDEFPACIVYRSGRCIHEAEICMRLRQQIYICQTSHSLIFKGELAEWCFSSYLKFFGVKMYKFTRLCAYFTEHYFLMPQSIEDILIDSGY